MRAALAILLLASCTHDLSLYDRVDVLPQARDLDVLFVFDDSPDRAQYDAMAAQLDVLQSRLKDVDGQLPSLHVGVTTTDLGTRGTLDTQVGFPVGNCTGGRGNDGRLVAFRPGGPSGAYLEDLRGPAGARVRNYASGDLVRELWNLTAPDVGTAQSGCEIEQPLEAMRRALAPSTNPGFIRPEAMLAVVFLTTDDDCSLARGALLDPGDASLGPMWHRCTAQGVICDPDAPLEPGTKANCRPRDGSPYLVDVSEYRTFLQQYKRDPGDVIVSAVAGARTPFVVTGGVGSLTLEPSCSGPAGVAKPAVRIGALVDAFGGSLVDTCTQDDAYQQLTAPILRRQRSCFPNLRKTDGDDCTVMEVTGTASTELARCAATSTGACWYMYSDAAACPGGDNLGIGVRRDATPTLAGSRIEATCFAK